MSVIKEVKHGGNGSRRRTRNKPKELVFWTDVPGEDILNVIAAIDRFGGAVRFGRNRAGTAYAVGIYGDGDSFTEYHEGSAGVSDWLAEIAADYSA